MDPNAPAISQIVQRFQLSRQGRAERNRADADWRVRVPVSAGQHTVEVRGVALVRHLVTRVRGRFSDFEGTIEYNADAGPQTVKIYSDGELRQLALVRRANER